MKKIILMLAICGGVVTLPAQVSNPVPEKTKTNTQTEDGKSGSNDDDWNDADNTNRQNPGEGKKDKTIAPDRKMDKRTNKNAEMPSGMSTTTYTRTPVENDKDQTEKDKTNVSIPDRVRNAFKKDHPNDDAEWSRDDKNRRYTAKYKETYKDGDIKNKVESFVTYDDGGKIIRTEAEVKYKDVPVAIVTYYEKNFAGGVVKVWQVLNKQDGTTKYYTMHEGKTKWFDREGKEMMDQEDWHHDMEMPKPYYK